MCDTGPCGAINCDWPDCSKKIDYLFPINCEDCSNRAASVVWENWCNGYIVTRFKCSSCRYEWDDIELD